LQVSHSHHHGGEILNANSKWILIVVFVALISATSVLAGGATADQPRLDAPDRTAVLDLVGYADAGLPTERIQFSVVRAGSLDGLKLVMGSFEKALTGNVQTQGAQIVFYTQQPPVDQAWVPALEADVAVLTPGALVQVVNADGTVQDQFQVPRPPAAPRAPVECAVMVDGNEIPLMEDANPISLNGVTIVCAYNKATMNPMLATPETARMLAQMEAVALAQAQADMIAALPTQAGQPVVDLTTGQTIQQSAPTDVSGFSPVVSTPVVIPPPTTDGFSAVVLEGATPSQFCVTSNDWLSLRLEPDSASAEATRVAPGIQLPMIQMQAIDAERDALQVEFAGTDLWLTRTTSITVRNCR